MTEVPPSLAPKLYVSVVTALRNTGRCDLALQLICSMDGQQKTAFIFLEKAKCLVHSSAHSRAVPVLQQLLAQYPDAEESQEASLLLAESLRSQISSFLMYSASLLLSHLLLQSAESERRSRRHQQDTARRASILPQYAAAQAAPRQRAEDSQRERFRRSAGRYLPELGWHRGAEISGVRGRLDAHGSDCTGAHVEFAGC